MARQWAARLADTDGVSLPPEELERILFDLARDAVAEIEWLRDAAISRFATLYGTAPVGIAMADRDGTIVEVNKHLAQFLGQKPDRLAGRRLTELGFADRDRAKLAGGLEELAETDLEEFTDRVQLAHADDAGVWAEIVLTLMPGDRPGTRFPVLVAADANEVHTLQEALRHQSIHDSLTGLSNASRFHTLLENALSPFATGQVALVYLDLDGFKVINDGLGAGVGDQVLRGVARKLKESFTEHDALVARLSGDGFAVLLCGELTAAQVITLVERALEDLVEPIYIGEHGVGVSASAGIVVRDVGEGSVEDIQRAAEIALHRAKEAGKAQWMLFDPELDARDRARYRLGAEIAGALENGQFELIYQPTVKLAKPDEIAAVNAGLRWHHPRFGDLSADEFYPLADTTGMTIPLGKWLLTESLRATARWRDRYGDAAPDVCIRLPNRLAIEPDLVAMVKEELDRNELPAKALRVCTDSSSILDPRGEVLDSLTVLSDLGAKLVLTVQGSSDLELIPRHELSVQHVILSGPVVDALADDEPDVAARHLDHLVERARELKLRIGAEGVRNSGQADRLRRHGVIAARGAFVAETATGDEVDELIEQHTKET
ncbi:diguanylate cyclase (GGDEF)-like protein/PAS domain S-box-containing protein [Amycolatopsis endophytica]|uniref:Diguanylate cyclase (GGDEF)-like protein/PAS domain S-box-containing protein n=1 Tax=Amycolatopsis endophytica TaxID=860233 RepID=A0A853B8Y4_9PSEU|nr:diguanylate cyclase [Amycolatopsis endophytica]NYI91207.1 diguanylate cyclase (GGDEF)-like protein/PAS domain S-box-containing protein [Amycolatopsis endophytica]